MSNYPHIDQVRNDKEHKSIMEKIDSFGEKIEMLSIKIAQMPDEILKRADERYASKTAEKVIYGIVGAICLAFLMGLWELIKRG
jgi:hypothetical protein